MTADDAVFTWHTIRDLEIVDGNWPTNVDLDFFDHAEAVDANTLKVFFSQEPGLPIWQFGLALAPILPEHYWGPVVEEAKASDDPAATLYAHDAADQPGSHCNLEQREAGAFVENKSHLDNHHQGTTVREYANGAYQEENADRPNRNFTVHGEATGDVDLELEIGPFVDSTVYNVYADQDSALLAEPPEPAQGAGRPAGGDGGDRDHLQPLQRLPLHRLQLPRPAPGRRRGPRNGGHPHR
jgi:ABC-type transport system substrate-binding protein